MKSRQRGNGKIEFDNSKTLQICRATPLYFATPPPYHSSPPSFQCSILHQSKLATLAPCRHFTTAPFSLPVFHHSCLPSPHPSTTSCRQPPILTPFHYSILSYSPFHHSSIPAFQFSSIPSFQYSNIPSLLSSITPALKPPRLPASPRFPASQPPRLPAFHHLIPPPLPAASPRSLHRSTIPSFPIHHSIIPAFQFSSIPPFHHSTIPAFQYSITPVFHHSSPQASPPPSLPASPLPSLPACPLRSQRLGGELLLHPLSRYRGSPCQRYRKNGLPVSCTRSLTGCRIDWRPSIRIRSDPSLLNVKGTISTRRTLQPGCRPSGRDAGRRCGPQSPGWCARPGGRRS